MGTSSRDAPSGSESAALDWRTRVLMLSGGFMTSLSIMGLTVVLPQIETQLAHDATDRLMVKLLATIGGLTMMIGAPLGGWLTDRLGQRRVIVASCLLYAVSGTAGLYLSSLPVLLASRLLLGLTAAALATMSMTLINTRLEGNGRAKWMGLHVSAALIGTLLVTPIIGQLAKHSWRGPFIIYIAALPLALIALSIREVRGPRAAAKVERRDAPGIVGWFPFRYATLAFVIGTLTYTPTVYLPFVARSVGVVSPVSLSTLMLADAVVAAIVSMLFGPARQRISAPVAFMLSFALVAGGMTLQAFARNFEVVVVGMLIFGAGQAWFVPNLMTAWSRALDRSQQGRAIGLIKASLYLAGPVGTLAAEPISRTYGPAGVMAALAILAGAILAAFVARLTAGGRAQAIGPATLAQR
jgi:MFS family permease